MSMTVTAPEHLAGGPSLPQQRRLVTAIPGPESQARMARKTAAVASGVSTMMPVFAVAAGGGVVVDADGNSLIDLGSGIAVTNVGNADPFVTEAVIEQVRRFTHTCFTITPYDGYVEVAEALNRLTPGDHEKRTALFNSGAEAVENAIKIARHYTGKSAVVAFDHGYHGRTNLTMALTAKAMPYKAGFGPFAPDVYRAPMSYPFRDGLSGAEAAERAIHMMERQIGADRLAAIIIEPIQGEGGFIVPAEGYLLALQEWCTANGIVFVADEVQSGVARTGAWYASEHFGLVPDMITTAKGIAGGMVLAGVVGRAEIMDSAHAGGLGGTYGGNPVACAAAIAVFEQIEERGLLHEAARIEGTLVPLLRELQAKHPVIGDVRGIGAMIAIEFVDPETHEPDAATVSRLAAAAAQHGVLVLTAGTYGNVIRFLPPLVISDELLREAVAVLDTVLSEA